MISIKDVAKLAGVSNKTVSRVVNNESNVLAATKDRVEFAIKQLDYVPNLSARATRTNRSNVFALVTEATNTAPFSVDIIRGVHEAVTEQGKTLIIVNTSGCYDQNEEYWRYFRQNRIDGVIYATTYYREVELGSQSQKLPLVLVNCFDPKHSEYANILPNDYQGSYDLTNYVLSAGHRKIAYIGLNSKLVAASLRKNAFFDAMADSQVSVNPEWVMTGVEGEVGQDTFFAYEKARGLLSQPERPSVIMCGNDEIALQIYSAAASLKLLVPEDVAIVGFDDFKAVSELIRPSLTTVALPHYDMGRKAVEMLKKEISGENVAGDYLSPCPVVKRDSL
jgi:LacI family transcriptional regulator